MSHPRRTVIAIATAACMAAAFTATMTISASAQTVTASAPAEGIPDCNDGIGMTTATLFWRCTGTARTSPWVGSSCSPGEYNAGSAYNVYIASNYCNTRVWLHEYTYPEDANSGWGLCISPGGEGPPASTYQHPENIQVTTNSAQC